jgi:hypothetical protein
VGLCASKMLKVEVTPRSHLAIAGLRWLEGSVLHQQSGENASTGLAGLGVAGLGVAGLGVPGRPIDCWGRGLPYWHVFSVYQLRAHQGINSGV